MPATNRDSECNFGFQEIVKQMKERFRMHSIPSRKLEAVKSVIAEFSPNRRYHGGDKDQIEGSA